MAASSHCISRLLLAALLCVSSTASAQPAPRTKASPHGPAPAAPGSPPNSGELDASAALERARIYYDSARYAPCVDAFTRLLERAAQLPLKARGTARVYLAACLIASGRTEEARQQFRQAILEDRQLQPPDPVVFPPAVVDVFVQVRSTLMEALERQQEEELERGRQEAEERARAEQRERWRVAELERLAALEIVVRRNERWMAWVPFGIGQFQNQDKTLGWIFLSSEAALAITALTATSIELGLHSQAEGGRAPLDSADLTSKVQAARQVGTVAWLTLVGVAAAGIIEANLSYRGEIEVGQRRRVLPDALRPREPVKSHNSSSMRPDVGLGWLGLSGEF
jgi:tetratricopeptide (TPR) repeat protein